tara:strand:+ start:393 stop:794 length:402 start_codon:yes stop_codon:yes gene_type:complete
MNNKNDLTNLPNNFRHEKKFLIDNNYNSWQKIRNISDCDINAIIKSDLLCTPSRLVKIRAIAIFIIDLDLLPHEASLLLHCGIGDIEALSKLNPDSLLKKIGRLERNLNLKRKSNLDISLMKRWITRAKNLSE